MDMRKAFGAVPKLEQEGIEVRFQDGAYVKLARAGGGNVRYDAAMHKYFQPYQRSLKNGTIDDKTVNEILHKVYSEAVILGWRGFELDGKDLAYSPEAALMVMKEFPEFWRIVQEEAGKFANFKMEETTEAGKA